MSLSDPLIFWVVVISTCFSLIWGLVKRRLRELHELVDVSSIILVNSTANCLGVKSRGRIGVRGNGCLALTESEVIFLLLWPRKRVRIPRSKILGVDTTRFHMGRSKGSQLLRITFNNAAGEKDIAAWQVSDLERWLQELQG